MFKNITLEQAFHLIKQNTSVLIIDLRDKEDFKKNHLENALNFSIYDLGNIKQLFSSLDVPIIIYCYSGIKSVVGAEKLLELGFKNIYNVKEGYTKILNVNS